MTFDEREQYENAVYIVLTIGIVGLGVIVGTAIGPYWMLVLVTVLCFHLAFWGYRKLQADDKEKARAFEEALRKAAEGRK